MIIEGQKVEVKWHGRNKNHYEKFGYIFTKVGDEFYATPEELPEKSHIPICISCDKCGEKKDRKRRNLNIYGNHFCSNSCAGSFLMNNNNPNPPKEKSEVICEFCDCKFEIFESILKKNKWHFCSRKCYASFRSENFSGESMYNYQELNTCCLICNKEFKTSKWYMDNNKDKFCSKKCYYEHKNTDEQIEKSRINTALRISNGMFPRTNTTIQVKAKKFTENAMILFEEEIPFKYYVLDLYSNEKNLAIEVMGDYWHSSPIKYPSYDDLNAMQKKNVTRDKAKSTYLKRYYNINILYLWETDINKRPELCTELIKLLISKNGFLDDYNSFNYNYEINNLKLNNDLTMPYFM